MLLSPDYLFRVNLSWAKYESLIQADLYLVVSSFFGIGLRLPSSTSLSCSFSRGVLTALVFVLHLDSRSVLIRTQNETCDNNLNFESYNLLKKIKKVSKIKVFLKGQNCAGVRQVSLTASVLRASCLEPFKQSEHQDHESVAGAHISVQ